MSKLINGATIAVLAVVAGLYHPTAVVAQTAPGLAVPAPSARTGEVTSDDVYVRSGPSLNHYTITKLAAGEQVTIVGENAEWFEILPPEGVFSLVSGEYVDAAPDGSTGVVNGNRVRVRAGSLLNDNKYTVQTLLSKGATVTILGRNPDGFVRIKPPAGATVWINRGLVALPTGSGVAAIRNVDQPRVSGNSSSSDNPNADRLRRHATPGSRAVDSRGSKPRTGSATDTASAVTAHPTGSAFAGAPTTAERRALDEIDAAAHREMAKPLIERHLDPLIDRYAVVAKQKRDVLASRYAQERIRQLRDVASIIKTVRDMRRLSKETASARREFLQKRAAIPKVELPTPSGLDVTGVLLISALYPPDRNPRRFRLVDASGPTPHTIAYVDVPVDFAEPLDKYVNHRVGVRATGRTWQEGGVEPVPVYVAGELVLLNDNERESTTPVDTTAPDAPAPAEATVGTNEDK